jgi:hypothetical protein
MNILLWITQAILALLLISGGGYKLFKSAELTAQFSSMSPLGWQMIGVIELLGGVLLVLPASLRFLPNHTSTTALVLLVEAIGISVFYARYSTRMSAENPLVFSALMALMLAFVAYGRYVRTATGA